MQIDLHSHSIFSDGTLTPEDLLARAATRGVKTLALTDHDETGGLAAARRAADAHGIQLVNGVEVSVTWSGSTVHIVGLNVDVENAGLQAGLAQVRAGRDERARGIAHALEDIGIGGAYEGARQFAKNPDIIGRTHFARFLVERKIVKDTSEAFKRFLLGGQPAWVPHQWAALEDAVRWITGSGGIAVVAHPGRYKFDNAQMRTLFGEFKALGGTAIEVVSGGHTPHQYQIFADYAQEFGLLASSGSDFHSPDESRCDLGGCPNLPAGCEPVWSAFIH